MNRITLLVFILGISSMTKGQVTSSATECEFSDQFEQAFERDAKRLALRYIYESGLPDSADAYIPNEYYEMMLANLAIARNETSEDWQYDVFDSYLIHTNGLPSLDVFRLTLDRNFDWVEEWLRQKTGSGNIQVDQLIKQYGLHIILTDYSDGRLVKVEIESSQLLNIRALLHQFRAINGVMEATEISDPAANRSDIIYSVSDLGKPQLTFRYNWGNCEKACLYQHNWICELNEQNCKVNYEVNKGDPLSVKLFDFFLRLDVFPNPTSDLVNLHMVGPPEKEIEVSLFSACGKKMKSKALNTNQGQLDVEVSLNDLPIGIYFVSFRTGTSIHTERVLKL